MNGGSKSGVTEGMSSERRPMKFFDTRKQKAYMFCLAGMGIDALLGLTKIFMGWQSGSISVIGDGFNNITDVGATFLLLLTFYYASKPSDRSHPFGYGRLEYLNSTVMAASVLYVGVSLVVDSGEKILEPESIVFSPLLVAVLIVGIVGKLLLSYLYRMAEKTTGSNAFSAYGADSISDVLSTTGVLVAVVAEHFTGWHIDGYVGIVISLAIIYTGFQILKRAVTSIIGAPPDSSLHRDIEQFMLSIPGIYGVHDLILHDYGPENHFLSAHVEMDSQMSLVESHRQAEMLMERLKEQFHIQAVIHVDPKAVANPKEGQYMRDLEAAIYRTQLPLTYHDFFVEEYGGEIYLSFELALTEKCKKTDEEIYEALNAAMKALSERYHISIMIDRHFVSGKRLGEEPEETLK